MVMNGKGRWSRFKDRAGSVKWFDSHRKIEQFGIKLMAWTAFLGVGFTISTVNNRHRVYEELMTVNNAGSTSTFSKTQDVTLTLGSSRLSQDKKTAYIPVTFSATDEMSHQANNFKIFVWTSDNKPLQYHVNGRFVMFGTTGRATLVLKSPESIKNQPLFIYFRNDKKIPSEDEATADANMTNNPDGGSSAYGKYDVARFKVNPGSRVVQRTSRLDANIDTDDGLEDLYETIFGTSDVKKVRKNIRNDQRRINQNMVRAHQLESELKDEGFNVPKEPAWMSSSWRPFDAVNIKTGMTKNGQRAASYSYDANNDPDNVSFPNSLTGKDGETTDNSGNTSNNQSDQNDSNENIGGTQSDPSDQWSKLVQAWQRIQTLKRDIYINQYTQLAKVYKQEKSILNQTSVGSYSHVKIKSPVKVKK